jgi:hypothetical protein
MSGIFGEEVAGKEVVVCSAIGTPLSFYPKKIFYRSGLTALEALGLI